MKNIEIFIIAALSITITSLFNPTNNNDLKKETINEDNLILENWMVKPFLIEETILEDSLIIEEWMVNPLI